MNGGALPAPPPPPARRGGARGCLLLAMAIAAASVALALVLVGVGLVFGGGASVPDGSVLVVRAGRDYPETLPYAPFFFMDPGPGFHDVLRAISAASGDSRIGGIHLAVEEGRLGWGRTHELRTAVIAAGAAGKRVTASFDYAGPRGMYLASAASRVTMHPRGQLGLNGLHMEVLYYGGLLEEVGIEAQFEAIGPWKTAPEIYTGSAMTPESRAQLTALGENISAEISRAVAEGRELSSEAAGRLLADGPWTARRALDLGLVDALDYHDGVEADVLGEGRGRLVAVADYLDSPAAPRVPAEARIAVVHVDGAIAPGRSREDVVFGRVSGAESVVEALERLENDDLTRAVVLRVSSPGGFETSSDSIWRAARRLREGGRPLIASFGDTAASGGYWIATAAETVLATPLTTTGSIGVFAGKFSLGGLFDRVGVTAETVDLGGSPGWSSLATPLGEAERARLREGLEDTYGVFLERVAEARGLTVEEVHAVAEGRVHSGAAALAAGLVDDFGGLSDAVRAAAAAAGIPDDAPLEVFHLPAPPSFEEALRAEVEGGFGGFLRRSPLLAAALSGIRLTLLPIEPLFR